MIPAHIRFPAPRAAVFACALAALALAACSSDPSSSLGSDNDLLSSTPGTVFEDSIDAIADTVLSYYTPIAADTVLEFGRVSGYQRTMIIQISFANATADAGKTVASAFLRLSASSLDGTISARFYQLTEAYTEGDSVPSLDTLAVIVDPVTTSPNRALRTVPRDYPLPTSLVQGWIRDQIARNAIGIVYTDDVNDKYAAFRALQSGHPAQLVVNFVGGTQSLYNAVGDATFVRPTTTTSNLVVSDGFVRRTYFRFPLDQLQPEAAIHNARVRLRLVPGSALGSAPNLIVFIPASDDPTSSEFLDGQLVTTTTFLAGADYIEFSVTNALGLTLQGTLEDNGFVVRFDAENSSLRQVQFYNSSAPDSLRPRLLVTSSTPADFDPEVP